MVSQLRISAHMDSIRSNRTSNSRYRAHLSIAEHYCQISQ